MIKYDWIASCCIFKEEYRIAGDIPINNGNYNALGVDVANSEEGDKACLAWGKKNEMFELHEFGCRNANDLALNIIYDEFWLYSKGRNVYHTGNIKKHSISPDRIGVDAVGIGVATVNTFEEHGYDVVSLQGGQNIDALPIDKDTRKPLYTFVSLRAQMYFTFAMECQKREFVITVEDQAVVNALIKEAVTPMLVTSGVSIAVEGKEHIKKRLGHSPNKLDAIVYWNWMRKDRNDKPISLMFK